MVPQRRVFDVVWYRAIKYTHAQSILDDPNLIETVLIRTFGFYHTIDKLVCNDTTQNLVKKCTELMKYWPSTREYDYHWTFGAFAIQCFARGIVFIFYVSTLILRHDTFLLHC